jgi:hypothetical protein
VQGASHPQSGLVEPGHRGGGDPVSDIGNEAVEPARSAPGHPRHGALTQRGAEQLRQRLGGAFLGQELAHIQVEDDRGDPRPVLHRRAHPVRRHAAGGGPTAATARDQLVLGHPHRDRRQVEHLAALHPDLGRTGQIPAAPSTRAGLVPQPFVRVVHQRQRRPRMPRLPTRLTAGLAPQRLRSRLHERRVRRRRARRVPRVHTQPATQLRVLRAQLLVVRPQQRNLTPKLLNQPRLSDDQGGKLVIRRTSIPGLHTLIISRRRSSLINDLTSYEIGCFEGDKAETLTIVPIVKQFAARHDLAHMVVVADAGMLSRKNLDELAGEGLFFIVGSRATKAPIDLESHFRWHGDAFSDGQVIDTITPKNSRVRENDTNRKAEPVCVATNSSVAGLRISKCWSESTGCR